MIGWLEKNRDPLNDSVVELLKKSTETFVSQLWDDYASQEERPRGKKGDVNIPLSLETFSGYS